MRAPLRDLDLVAKHYAKIAGRALPIEWTPHAAPSSQPLAVGDTPEGSRALAALTRLLAVHSLDPTAASVLYLAHVRCGLSAPLRAGDSLDVTIYAEIGKAYGGAHLPPEPPQLPQRKGRKAGKAAGDRQGWLRLRAKAAEKGARLYGEAVKAWEGVP